MSARNYGRREQGGCIDLQRLKVTSKIRAVDGDPLSSLAKVADLRDYFHTSATNSSKSSNKARGCSRAAKCPPSVCCLCQTTLAIVLTHAFGTGAISLGNHEYPKGLEI